MPVAPPGRGEGEGGREGRSGQLQRCGQITNQRGQIDYPMQPNYHCRCGEITNQITSKITNQITNYLWPDY